MRDTFESKKKQIAERRKGKTTMEAVIFTENELKKVEKSLADAQCVLIHLIYGLNYDLEKVDEILKRVVQSRAIIEDLKMEAEIPF